MPSPLEQQIFESLRYYRLFEYQLTEWQLWWLLSGQENPKVVSPRVVSWGKRFLNPPMSLFEKKVEIGDDADGLNRLQIAISWQDFLACLTKSSWLRSQGIVRKKGRVWLKTENDASFHQSSAKLLRKRWARARRIVALLARLPFVRMIGVSGSLALDQSRPGSDIDLFIVSDKKRVWLVRAMSISVLWPLRLYRRPKKEAGRFCLNHFVTVGAERLDHQNAYTARLFSQLHVAYGLKEYQRFQQQNVWIKGYIQAYPLPFFAPFQIIRLDQLSRLVKQSLELLLFGLVGGTVDRLAGWLQRRHITQDPRQRQSSAQVVLSDKVLRFHLDAQEPKVLGQLKK